MAKFDSPLDNVRVASPCKANWDEMYGDECKRFCGECKMSVYNLSGMSRSEAESLIITTEGRLCVRYFKRPDGTILTRDCPVGWRAAKRRVSKVATAVFSVIAGLLAGVFALAGLRGLASFITGPVSLESVVVESSDGTGGEAVQELDRFDDGPMLGEVPMQGRATVGRPEMIYLKNSEGKGLRAK